LAMRTVPLLLALVALAVARRHSTTPAPTRSPVICNMSTPTVCPKGTFCAQADGICGGLGVCTTKPAACPRIVKPVCSCSNQTFGNDCEAQQAGQNVLYQGACAGSDNCTNSTNCHPQFEYCNYGFGHCKGQGRCAAVPVVCPAVVSFVCGCDGRSYENPCHAAAADTSIVGVGRCPRLPSCLSDGACGKNGTEYCMFPQGQCGGTGTCTAIPSVCPGIVMPVCGCDGKTYTNSCKAAVALVSVKARGACPS